MIDILDPKLQNYARNNGVRAQKILAVMNKNRQLINALSTPTGQELLKDVLELANDSLEKFINMDIDKSNDKWREAKSDYESAMRLVNRYLSKINKFQNDLEKMTK